MNETLSAILHGYGFMPHGHCYLWNPTLVSTMVVTDTLIFLAYTSISWTLYYLVRKIKLPFNWMFVAFGIFIAACGVTHAMEVLTLWTPAYWISALIKTLTASASVLTAILLFPLMPKVVNLAKTSKLSEEHRLRLIETSEQLRRQTIHLEAVNGELEEFCQAVSHDLRAPLRSMMAFSTELKTEYGDQLAPPAKQNLDRVLNSAKRMGELIDGLLTLSRLTRSDLQTETINLSKITLEIHEDFKRNHPERQVDVRIGPDLIVQGDSRLLQAAMVNLFENSWKFTSKQPHAQIEFGKKWMDGTPVYFIKDNGAGFDMQYAHKLFGSFQRLHSIKEFEGNGVGLATVKRIIQRHGGKIWAESELNRGTTFYFTI
mgnify:CR=1 FL=1